MADCVHLARKLRTQSDERDKTRQKSAMGDLGRPRHAVSACTRAGRLHARPCASASGIGLMLCSDAVECARIKVRRTGSRRHRASRRRARRSRLSVCAKCWTRSVTVAAGTHACYRTRTGRRGRPCYSNLVDLRAHPPAIPPRTTVTRLKLRRRRAVRGASRSTACLAHCAMSIGISSRALCIHQ